MVAMLTTSFAGVSAQKKATPNRLTQDQKILHVLNRLGFGARPGDVERVKSIGLENYIKQQLNPGMIDDAIADAKVKTLASLSLTTAELYEKYPQPGMIVRELQRRGELPPALADAAKNRVKGDAGNQGAAAVSTNGETMMAAPNSDAAKSPSTPVVGQKPQDNQEYRRALRDYYMQNGLQQPQRITAELQASRILKAVYSERQLQEVMVDFWTNHFNVFAGKGANRWLLVSYDRDTIRPHALGNFEDLLVATAQSPAMLFYLDNFQSVSPNAAAQRAQQRPTRR